MVFDVEAVFGKARVEEDDLIAGIENRFEDNVDGARRARGHQHVICGESDAGASGQAAGDRGSDFGEAGVRHVAATARAVLRDDTAEYRNRRRRWLDVGIADREIEDVVRAAFLAELDSDLEHAPDPGGTFQLRGDGAGDRQARL